MISKSRMKRLNVQNRAALARELLDAYDRGEIMMRPTCERCGERMPLPDKLCVDCMIGKANSPSGKGKGK
jgi:hypothetical protein